MVQGPLQSEGTSDERSDVAEAAHPQPTSRREARKQETRNRLLSAARQLFISRGFDETSFDDIAEAAGVARQTAFNHFPRKDDFLAAWVSERRAELQTAIDLNDPGSPFDAATRLLLIMRVMAGEYEQRREEGRVFMIAWVKSGGPIFEAPVAAHLLAEVIRDGQREGAFVVDVDAETVGEVIRAIYFDVLWRWASPHNEVPPGGLFETLIAHIQVVLTGLCVESDRQQLKKSVTLVRTLEVARLASPAATPSTE